MTAKGLLALEYNYVVYIREDGGGYWATVNLVLYPGKPVPAASIPDWFLARLLEENIVAYCDADGNLKEGS